MRVREAPPPLPPESRTVGQLVAEAIRLYGRRFWRSLPLGLSLATIDQISAGEPRLVQALVLLAGAPLMTASYIGACALAGSTPVDRGRLLRAFAAGVLVFLPFPFLIVAFVLPGLAWLALVGLTVPVILFEGRPVRAALRRATELARADYVHALGSLAALSIAFFLARLALFFLLRGQGEQTGRIALFLADLVLSPILFLGAALLYFDQAARVGRRRAGKR